MEEQPITQRSVDSDVSTPRVSTEVKKSKSTSPSNAILLFGLAAISLLFQVYNLYLVERVSDLEVKIQIESLDRQEEDIHILQKLVFLHLQMQEQCQPQNLIQQ